MTGRSLISISAWTVLHMSQPARHAVFSQQLRASTMNTNLQQPKGRDGVLSSFNVAIDAMNLAKDTLDITSAQAAFGSVSVLLTMIRVRSCLFSTMSFWFKCIQDSMVNDLGYVELGLNCADICRALDRGMNEKKLNDLSQSVSEAINQLMA